MPRIKPWTNFFGSISLLIIAFWWIFFLARNLGVIKTLQSIAFVSDPPTVGTDISNTATERAYEYSTKSTKTKEDVFFSEAEISHLKDVSYVYQVSWMTLSILSLVSFSYLIFTLLKKKNLSAKMFLGARNLILFSFLFLLVSSLFFTVFFDGFHQLLFPQGNWMFPAGSLLLEIFPETFWRIMLVFITVESLGIGLLYHLAAHELSLHE